MAHEFGTAQWSETATAVAGTATATRAAVAGRRHYITSMSYSANGAVAAATTVEIRSGSTVLARFQVPPAAFAPVALNFDAPLACAQGEAASIVAGSFGAGISGSVNIHGYSTQ